MYSDTAAVAAVPAGATSAALFAPTQAAIGLAVLAALSLVIGVVLALLFMGFSVKGLAVAAAAGAAGFFLPDLLLYNAGVKRQQELQKGLASWYAPQQK